jgi:hypothetical protein
MSGLNQHGNEALVFYQKKHGCDLIESTTVSAGRWSERWCVFEMSMGILQKKSLPSLVMSGLNQHGNEASVFHQETWL